MSELIRNTKDDAILLADRASAVFHDTPGLEATAGMFFQNVAPQILAQGGTFRVRKLSDDGQYEEYDQQWPALCHVGCRHITKVSEVFRTCTDVNSLYCFLGNMPGFDACRPPSEYFNFPVGKSHPISIDAAMEMSERVSKGDQAHLYFVVPGDRFDAGWKTTQSFARAGLQSNLKKLTDPDPDKRDENLQKLNVDDKQVNLLANNLVQYALRMPTWNGGSRRQFSTMTSAVRSGGNGMTARVIRRMWKLMV